MHPRQVCKIIERKWIRTRNKHVGFQLEANKKHTNSNVIERDCCHRHAIDIASIQTMTSSEAFYVARGCAVQPITRSKKGPIGFVHGQCRQRQRLAAFISCNAISRHSWTREQRFDTFAHHPFPLFLTRCIEKPHKYLILASGATTPVRNKKLKRKINRMIRVFVGTVCWNWVRVSAFRGTAGPPKWRQIKLITRHPLIRMNK